MKQSSESVATKLSMNVMYMFFLQNIYLNMLARDVYIYIYFPAETVNLGFGIVLGLSK